MEFFFIILVLIMSVVVHEVSHGYAALALGDPTAKYQGRLTLNPFSHLDPVGSVLVPLLGYFAHIPIIGWAKPVPFNPYNLRNARWGEAMVAIAGPLSNIALAVIFGLILRLAAWQGVLNETFAGLASFVIIINVTLALFNLIPIPPLDGSKILFALIPYKFQNVRHSLEQYGFALVLVFVFFFWHFLTPLVEAVFKLIVG